MSETREQCERCGQVVEIGQWPFCPHGKPTVAATAAFAAYFDIGLGQEIRSAGDRRAAMREGTTFKGRKHRLEFKGRKVGMPGCEI